MTRQGVRTSAMPRTMKALVLVLGLLLASGCAGGLGPRSATETPTERPGELLGTSSASLLVSIMDEEHRPQSGVVVALRPATLPGQVTDADGNVWFRSLAEGRYVVLVPSFALERSVDVATEDVRLVFVAR